MASEILKTPKLSEKARIGQLPKSFPGQLLVFAGVFIAATLLQSVIPCLFIWDEMISAMNTANINSADSKAVYDFYLSYKFPDSFMILSLFCTGIGTLLTMLYCRGFERRKISSMGFVKRNALKNYFFGALFGVSMLAVSIAVCVIFGCGKLSLAVGISPLIILGYLAGFVVQGMYEEVIFRGYFFVSTAAEKPTLYAIAANSVLFSLAHALNSGIRALAFVNIALFGVLMSLIVMLTESIWCASALHSFWNFTQGNIFGVSTSGMSFSTSVLEFSPKNGSELINGGSFGIEGGLASTFTILAAIIIVLVLLKRKTAQDNSSRAA